MTIAVVGLGLIGGSLAKAASEARHTVLGQDISDDVMARALKERAIAKQLVGSENTCSLIIIALNPFDAVTYVKENAAKFRGSIVIDLCGVKRHLKNELAAIAADNGFLYLGGHPMAGREYSGYSYSDAKLFCGASMILTPGRDFPQDKLEGICRFFIEVGFGNIKFTTESEHDEVIAFTSQLAHIVSNAYVRSDTALRHSGFSAGSFRDLTRVAYLNEEMWSELFLLNGDYLAGELDNLISRLGEYSKAIKNSDKERLKNILREGKESAELVRAIGKLREGEK